MDYCRIMSVANTISNKFETRNPFKIAACLGINLRFDKLGHLKGFYTCILKNRYIAINENLDDISAKIVCAHEIGHDRFHRGLGVNMFKDEMCISLKTATPEIESNYFAAELLIPDDRFFELAGENATYEHLAYELEVHKELVMIKARLLNARGHKLNIPYIPNANFLANTPVITECKVAEENCTYLID